MIAHHARQKAGGKVERPRTDSANEPERGKRAEVVYPGFNGICDKVRNVFGGCAGLCGWVVKTTAGRAPDRLSNMAIVAGLGRRDGRHEVVTVNQAVRELASARYPSKNSAPPVRG